MNKQLFIGTVAVALIIGGIFLVGVRITLNQPADLTNVQEVLPPSTALQDDDFEKGKYDDDNKAELAPTPVVTPTPAPVPTPTPTLAPTKSGYTLADVATHNNAASCWMAIRGKVYDVTSFISRHPGGNRILQGCGKDATPLFEGVKGHLKQTTLNLLPGFYKGELVS